MNVNRRDFIGGTLAALGFSALPGGLIFAAPSGKTLTFAVRPLTSLGTSGRPIITDFKV